MSLFLCLFTLLLALPLVHAAEIEPFSHENDRLAKFAESHYAKIAKAKFGDGVQFGSNGRLVDPQKGELVEAEVVKKWNASHAKCAIEFSRNTGYTVIKNNPLVPIQGAAKKCKKFDGPKGGSVYYAFYFSAKQNVNRSESKPTTELQSFDTLKDCTKSQKIVKNAKTTKAKVYLALGGPGFNGQAKYVLIHQDQNGNCQANAFPRNELYNKEWNVSRTPSIYAKGWHKILSDFMGSEQYVTDDGVTAGGGVTAHERTAEF